MENRQRRRKISAAPQAEELRSKFTRLVCRHEQVKIAYHRLKSQINNGLIEAEEVFASLAVPLTKLVGLKSGEMANEGRFSSIVFDVDVSRERQKSTVGFETSVAARGQGKGDGHCQIRAFEVQGPSFSARASIVSKDLVENQRLQIARFVGLLKQIEVLVNSCQDDIFHKLHEYRLLMNKFFQKAIHSMSSLPHQNDNSVIFMLKLFQITFNNINVMLGFVEEGVEDLTRGLSEQMCKPMVDYVKSLKNNMENGTCVLLLAMVEEMEKIITDGRLELEDARKQARVAEIGKIEALCMLNAIEEQVRRPKFNFRSHSEASVEQADPHFPVKFLYADESRQADDHKFTWEVMKKRRYHFPKSPPGREELLHVDTNIRPSKFTRTKPLVTHKPAKNRYVSDPCPQTPRSNVFIPLGFSPSVAIQQVFPPKSVTS